MTHNLDKSTIKISLTFARYVLAQATAFVSHLYGQNYNPAIGEFSNVPPYENRPLVEDIIDSGGDYATILHWVTSAGALLRTLAGILAFEISRTECLVENDLDELSLGDLSISDIKEFPRLARPWPPYFGYDLEGWPTPEEYDEYRKKYPLELEKDLTEIPHDELETEANRDDASFGFYDYPVTFKG